MKPEQKNKVLATLQSLIEENAGEIIQANKIDLETCARLDPSLLERLEVNDKKIEGMCASIQQAIGLEDPVGKVLSSYQHPNGMLMKNVTVPFGKILIVYESRPDVTVEASVIAFKAGNKVLLKGGKESKNTNKRLVDLWHKALEQHGESTDYIQYLDLDREATQRLIHENTERVDLIIPRGGEGLISFVTNNTQVPVLVSGRGNNFLYVDKEADLDMAINIILNGKSRLSVCNALDKVLINSKMQNSGEFLSKLVDTLRAHQIEVWAGPETLPVAEQVLVGSDELLDEEFLSAKMYLRLVDSTEEAIWLINRHSGGHSATIISKTPEQAELFLAQVDCAAVYHNVSTRFTDGGQFGFGAEIAVSTQKLHARGPIGLDQLVSNKWLGYGNGQIR